MFIIGEKINGTLKSIQEAILKRDAVFIEDMAKRQFDAGAAYLDINAGTNPDREADDMVWIVRTVQEVVDVPLCLDSPNPPALRAGLEVAVQTPMINSISGEKTRLENILPLVAEHSCPVIALAVDDMGIPQSSDERVKIINSIMAETQGYGIPDNRVFIDPLVMALSTNPDGALVAFETMQRIRSKYSEINFTMGLSNISFGLPARKFANRTFLTLAMYHGLESAIADPLNIDIKRTILATDLALNKDRFAQNYSKAYRSGVFS